ncbi:MAG TPA: hypothetical protein VN969_08340 [Streptosporangiaceae bacterium]|nr:hypothetical protein [Streptosporangiaceae bacterium]
MIALITGPPRVGKTTTARNPATVHGDHVETVSLGQLVYQEATARTPMTYQEFRAAAAGIVTAAGLRAASDALAARAAAALGDGRWLIVESHAVGPRGVRLASPPRPARRPREVPLRHPRLPGRACERDPRPHPRRSRRPAGTR